MTSHKGTSIEVGIHAYYIKFRSCLIQDDLQQALKGPHTYSADQNVVDYAAANLITVVHSVVVFSTRI